VRKAFAIVRCGWTSAENELNETEGEVWMRLLIVNLLAAALLVFTAATASAVSVTMVSAQDGGAVGNGGQIIIDINYDSQGTADVAVLGTGVYFNPAAVSYNQAASTTNSYLLYTKSKAAYLIPTPGFCDAVTNCVIWPGGGPTKVKVDFSSNKLPGGVPGVTGGSFGAISPILLTRLVFDVIDDSQTAVFTLSMDTLQGDVLALSGGVIIPLGLGADVVVNVPEPTTALLIGLGLVGLGVAGRRNR
jgi:hypothetical protein